MATNLKYTLCRTRTNTPLVSIESNFGNGQEFDPKTLRELAEALKNIADESEKIDLGKHYKPTKKSIDI